MPDNHHPVVPAAEHDRFRDDYCPRLRRTATVVSADGSFTPPTISAPALVLHADYRDRHELEIGWWWVYQVGDTRRRIPLGSTDAEDDYRDTDAERDILAGLTEPPQASTRRCRGIDTMRFTTETLPALAAQTGVEVEIGGTPADYREAGEPWPSACPPPNCRATTTGSNSA